MSDGVDKSLIGNEKIEKAIEDLKNDFSDEKLAVLLTIIRKRISENGQLVVAVDANSGVESLALKTASYNGKKWFVAYTSFDEEMKGELSIMSGFLADIDKLLDMVLKSNEVEGIIINPYGNMLSINKQIILAIKQ